MASSSSLELNLNLKPSYVPKTITNLLKNLSKFENSADKLMVLNDYIIQLETELNNISTFRHHLPQCMMLLVEALGTLKDEFMTIKSGMRPESEGPLIEFLSMKRKFYEGKKTDMSGQDHQSCGFVGKSLMGSSSSCLWNSKQKKIYEDFMQASYGNPNSLEPKSSRFASFAAATTNNNGEGGLKLMADDQTLNYNPKPPTQPCWKKNRRSWSPQLHARFLEAVHIIGGIEMATPKQIRKVMQVEGLTNDQVKSHLQKYRLHRRRLPGNNLRGLSNYQDPWTLPSIFRRPFNPEG